MVAKYKVKRLAIEMANDSSKHRGGREKVNGAERAYAKKLSEYLVSEYRNSPHQDKEEQFDLDLELDMWCYEQERGDPSYVCRCFVKKDE